MTATTAADAIRATDDNATRYDIFTAYTTNNGDNWADRAWENRMTRMFNQGIRVEGDQIVAE